MKPWLGTGLVVGLFGIATAQTGWVQRSTPVAPSMRAFHGMAYDQGRGVTVLFGGWDSATYRADTWEWDGALWTQRTPATAPSPRCVHAMTYDMARGRVVLFGGAVGSGNGTDNDETWEYDGVTWTQMQPVVRPSARRGMGLTYDPVRGVCVLFGGGLAGSGIPALNDTWEWNGLTWTQYLPAVRPPARWQGFLAADGTGRAVLTGGGVGTTAQIFNDTWTWNGVAWQQLSPAAQPTARRYGGCAFDSQRGALVTWSGTTPTVGPNGWAWVWDGTNWRLDSRPNAPVGRYGTSAAYDMARGRVVMFGGYNGLTFADTWEYVAGPLATAVTSGAGCAGTSGVPSLGSLNGTLPVLGTTWTLRVGYGTSNAIAAVALGTSDQVWIGGALPVDLTALGMIGCTLRVSTDFIGGVGLASGVGTMSWVLPATPSLAGVRVFAQALVFDAAANPFGAVLSNALAATTGPY